MRWPRMIPSIGPETRKDLKEGALSLMLCNVGDYISGFFLQFFEPFIRAAPILIALLPAASDARGDTYSSYGSRLGTLLHLGLYRRYIRCELEALVTLLIGVNLWVGFLVMVIHAILGGGVLSPLDVAFIPLLSAMLSALFMVPATTWLAHTSFRKGLDPDNLVSPIATLFGDIVTIPTIVASYVIATDIDPIAKAIYVGGSIGVATLLFTRFVRRVRRGVREYERAIRVVRENLPIIMASTSFSALAGAILLSNISSILAWKGILAVIPAFLEDGGAIACRFSARLTTMLHLGRIRLEPVPRHRWVYAQIGINFVHALMIFTSLGLFGAAMSIAFGGGAVWAIHVFAAVELAGFMLTAIVSLLTYYLALASFKAGIDPDNVLAPLLTSMADAIGTSSLALMMMVLGAPH